MKKALFYTAFKILNLIKKNHTFSLSLKNDLILHGKLNYIFNCWFPKNTKVNLQFFFYLLILWNLISIILNDKK